MKKEEYTCFICLELPSITWANPMEKCKNCRHILHQYCYLQYIESSGNERCPVCKDKVNKKIIKERI